MYSRANKHQTDRPWNLSLASITFNSITHLLSRWDELQHRCWPHPEQHFNQQQLAFCINADSQFLNSCFGVAVLSCHAFTGNTRPGSCAIPIEPGTRWAGELPWEVRCAPKLWRLIVPEKPLPLVCGLHRSAGRLSNADGDFVIELSVQRVFLRSNQTQIDPRSCSTHLLFDKSARLRPDWLTIGFFWPRVANGSISRQYLWILLVNNAVGRHIENGYRSRNACSSKSRGHTNFASSGTWSHDYFPF